MQISFIDGKTEHFQSDHEVKLFKDDLQSNDVENEGSQSFWELAQEDIDEPVVDFCTSPDPLPVDKGLKSPTNVNCNLSEADQVSFRIRENNITMFRARKAFNRVKLSETKITLSKFFKSMSYTPDIITFATLYCKCPFITPPKTGILNPRLVLLALLHLCNDREVVIWTDETNTLCIQKCIT